MNAKHLTSSRAKRRQAMALVMVITTVALISILIVAIFSVTQTEYKATQSYIAARTAKQLADASVAITQAQIQNAQNTATSATARTIHATQPGMARVYSANGSFLRAHKLYSSAQMTVTGTSESVLFSAAHQVPGDWKTQPARFVDLNEPVIRPSVSSATDPAVYYPVIDPRAAYNFLGPQTPPAGSPTTQVEGFSYDNKTASGAGGSVSYAADIVLPVGTSDPLKLRLPMPVEWLYILQDGTTGALNNSNQFVSATPGVQPSRTNPIVGRVAFWADDESCKINVNTASEPTYMGSPYFYHERDRKWAHFPAASGEYQRYPGHPATVALSAVLAPNYRLDPLMPDVGLTQQNIVTLKEYLYEMSPKIAVGGSFSGTLPFVTDDFSKGNNESPTVSQSVNTAAARSERLYASVDEMLFKDGGFDPTTGRLPAQYPFPGSASRTLFDRDTLERSRFFLTAQSRAPEFSIYGLPRVCMWPVAEETMGDSYRTNFDNMIALCATLKSGSTGAGVANSYIFRRQDAHSATVDLPNTGSGGLARNAKLLDYLASQMSGLVWPRTSNLGNSTNFSEKYGLDNVHQLAVEFFDYIRCTNLYDGILARSNDGTSANAGTNYPLFYQQRDGLKTAKRTYTEQRLTPPPKSLTAVDTAQATTRADDEGVLPGHGQVTPALWDKAGQKYRGFGRMFTLSELGFQFICTADGKNDPPVTPHPTTGAPVPDPLLTTFGVQSGGGTAWRVADPTNKNSAFAGVWYSNFPPLTQIPPAVPLLYGTEAVAGPKHPAMHPGYNPENWNMTLAANTPLQTDEKRIQAIFLMESFCPSLGWTKLYPDYTIVVDGDYIGQIRLNGTRLFDTTGWIAVKSNSNLYQAGNVHSVGGHAAPSAMVGGRGGRPVSGAGGSGGPVMMGSDRNYMSDNPTGHEVPKGINGLKSYGLTSNCITVKRNLPTALKPEMQLEFPKGAGPLVIKIYDNHHWDDGKTEPIQIIKVKFSGAPTAIPVPHLVEAYNEAIPPAREGGVGNTSRKFNPWTDTMGRDYYRRSLQGPKYWCLNYEGCLGRYKPTRPNLLYGTGAAPFWLSAPAPYGLAELDNPERQVLRGRLDNSARAAVGWNPPGAEQQFGITPDDTSDVIRTWVPVMGDYRILAARYTYSDKEAESFWQPHPSWNSSTLAIRQAHSFTNFGGHTEPGARLATNPTDSAKYGLADLKLQMVAGVPYNIRPDNTLAVPGVPNPATGVVDYNWRQPDLPGHIDWATAANSFGDFDNGISSARDGPYINKPDEGNFYAGYVTLFNTQNVFYRSGYFFDSWKNSDDWRSGVYMTPNRLVSSPVMFGSLSTGVWAAGGSVPTSAQATSGTSMGVLPYRPWQTLLFRPHAKSIAQGTVVSKENHPGEYSPKDHLLLDMFFMPVVEPYAISEPLSVAGRINLNYQIMPFTYIRRATGVHALMKGEFMTAIPNQDVTKAKAFKQFTKPAKGGEFWDDATDRKFWHRPIDLKETLRQFDEKFANDGNLPSQARGLFRSASQICEVHLMPEDRTGPNIINLPKNMSPGDRQTQMNTFWRNHSATGDNVRERPYSNLYSRVTTRSNTFRVHMRAQVVRKARSVDPAVFDPNKDAILSEYRGSTLIERYIDPTDTANPIPDYAASTTPLSLTPLDTFYKFRTLESKRFSP